MVRQRKIVDATALCPGTAGICISDRSKAPPISVDLHWSPSISVDLRCSSQKAALNILISSISFKISKIYPKISQVFPFFPPSPVPFFFCSATATFAAQRPRSWCGNWAAPWWRSCWWRRCSWWWRWRTQISGGFSDGKTWGFHGLYMFRTSMD